MSVILRVLLMAGALFLVWWILHKIRKMKVQMEDAIFWIIFSVLVLALAIFPQISYKLSYIIGIESPANLIFLIVVFLLIDKVFALSVKVSLLEEKISVLSAEIALRSQAHDKQIEGFDDQNTN